MLEASRKQLHADWQIAGDFLLDAGFDAMGDGFGGDAEGVEDGGGGTGAVKGIDVSRAGG